MNAIKTLSRDEMKHIMAGGGCRIAVRNSEDGSFMYWSQPNYSVEEAQGDYQSGAKYLNGGYASGIVVTVVESLGSIISNLKLLNSKSLLGPLLFYFNACYDI